MEINSYNWSDGSSNMVGICLKEGNNKIMVWCDGDDYELEGVHNRRYQHFGGGGFASADMTDEMEAAHALGEALLQMIGGYR